MECCIQKFVFYLERCLLLTHLTGLKISQSYVKATVPAKYHDIIFPTYRACPSSYFCICDKILNIYAALGCRRIIRDEGYLQSLNRSNVRLTFDHIVRVEPDGVITTTGIRYDSSIETVLTELVFD